MIKTVGAIQEEQYLDVSDEWGAEQLSEDDGEEHDQPQPEVDTVSESEDHFSVSGTRYLGGQHLSR